jgi:hypothetical protein
VPASDGEAREYRVHDLRMRFLGLLDAPYGTNIPHPMIVPIAEGGRTRYWCLTFEGTQYYEQVLGYGTHGDLIVPKSRHTVSGSEFPTRR